MAIKINAPYSLNSIVQEFYSGNENAIVMCSNLLNYMEAVIELCKGVIDDKRLNDQSLRQELESIELQATITQKEAKAAMIQMSQIY